MAFISVSACSCPFVSKSMSASGPLTWQTSSLEKVQLGKKRTRKSASVKFVNRASGADNQAHEQQVTVTTPSIHYGYLQHVGMLVQDTAAAKRFYTDVLGMTDDHALRNPKLPFDGTFLRAGNSQIHLMELPSVDPTTGRPDHGGRDKHAALTVKSLEPLIESLERHGVAYTFSKSGRRAVFLRDIDANALEFMEDPDM